MEVHAHTHTARKKWPHYFWEFLMLFLAVFCGFLAEYQLEHVIEKQREKIYIKSLLEETKLDITEYDKVLKKAYDIDPIADSLFHNVKEVEKYNYRFVSRWSSPFNNLSIHYFPSLTTIQQLKNSGNLRLIRSQELQQQIILYETFVQSSVLRSSENMLGAMKGVYKLMNELCDLTDFNESITKNYKNEQSIVSQDYSFEFEMPIIFKTPEKLNDLANSFADFRAYLYGYIVTITQVKQKANNLVTLIRQEYKIE